MAKNTKKEEIESIEEKVEQKENKIMEQRLIYIGNDIKTRELFLNKFTILLSKPDNYEELLKKYPELEKLIIAIEDFPKISGEMVKQKQAYYKALAARVNKAMLEGGK